MVLLMEGLRNHIFIIPRPKKKSKGNINEKAGNRLLCSSADFLPGACRTAGDGVLVRHCKRLNYVRAGLDFSRNR